MKIKTAKKKFMYLSLISLLSISFSGCIRAEKVGLSKEPNDEIKILEGYGELQDSVNKILAPYVDIVGELTTDNNNKISNEIYEYATSMVREVVSTTGQRHSSSPKFINTYKKPVSDGLCFTQYHPNDTVAQPTFVVEDAHYNERVYNKKQIQRGEIDLTYPKITTGIALTDQKINAFIEDSIKKTYVQYKTDWENDIPNGDEINKFLATYEITFRTDKVVSILINASADFGMHGTYFSRMYTIDLVTGEPLNIRDLLIDDSTSVDFIKSSIIKLVKNSNNNKIPFKNYAEIINNGNPNDNWHLSATGITFIFDPYVLGPYSSGKLIYTVPYSDLAPYFNDYGKALLK